MTVIAIAGGSASGKSTLAEMVSERDDVIHVNMDNYYRDQEEQPETWDDPSALDWDSLSKQVRKFVEDDTSGFMQPIYSFEEGRREAGAIISHGEHLVIEGLWAHYGHVAQYADVLIYLDTPVEIRMERRVNRDTEERGCTVDEAISYFMQARAKEKEHIEPHRDKADFVIEERPTETHGRMVRRMMG